MRPHAPACDRMRPHAEARGPRAHPPPSPRAAPYYVGGTAFSRNPPMPENVKIVLDFGREGDFGH